MNQICYLDNAATTKSAPQVVERMMKSFQEDYFNPSAMYKPGLTEEKVIQGCKAHLMAAIHGKGDAERQIIYTSGGSEGDNLLIRGILDRKRPALLENGTIVTTAIEHPAVREVFLDYEKRGVKVIWLPVDAEGFVDSKDLAQAVDAHTLLVRGRRPRSRHECHLSRSRLLADGQEGVHRGYGPGLGPHV